jgi:predicted dehydrogenase
MNIGIIGCGLIGKKRAKTLKGHELVMTCDIDITKAKNLNPTQVFTDDWRHVINCEKVETVIISTTNDLCVPIAIEAAKKGKHILIEKPAARNSKELKKLLKYEDVKIKVGFNLRFHSAFLKAKEIINDLFLGDLMFIRANYGHGGRLGYEKDWRFDVKKSGGGELIDQGVHLIDLSRMFLGDFKKIDGYTKNYFWDIECEDNGFLSLETEKNQTAWLNVSCTEWRNSFEFEIYGKRGKIKISGLGGSYGTETLTVYQMDNKMGLPEITTFTYLEDNSWQKEMDSFIAGINCDWSSQRLNGNIYDAYEALKIVDKIYGK